MRNFTRRQAAIAALLWLAAYLAGAVLLPETAHGAESTDKARAAHEWARMPVCRDGRMESCRTPARCETDGDCAEMDDSDDTK